MLALSKSFQNQSWRNVSRKFGTKMEKFRKAKVQVRQGVVVGEQRVLPNGNPFNCFQGIPYAVPPLGHRRFKSPEPLERFEVPELDCSKEGNISHQRDPFTMEVAGSENCLFLNIYSPTLTKKSGPLPVMVWVHGGGFWFGNANSDSTYPLSLMEEDVVVVTLNYRLGALGFLCYPEAGIWGNAGLKDQRLALQWVQENIANFNGDPHNVTLFGESAGAACVHLHCYASHANKLFHKAICQSGTANMEWVFQVNPTYKTRYMAERLGCTSTDPQKIVQFLQSEQVTAVALLANTLPVLTPDERRRGLPLAFRPVVEDSSSPDPIIKEPILKSLSTANTLNLPLIMGYNTAEGMPMVVNALKKLPECDKDLARFVPRNIPLPPEHAEIQNLAQQIRQFYLGGRSISPDLLDALTNLLSDYHFTVDMQKAAQLQARLQPKAPLYFYRFNYVGGHNLYKRIFQLENLRGACHADDLCYLFQMAGGATKLHGMDALIVKRMSRLWGNFARYGNPTPDGTIEPPLVECAWEAVKCPQNGEDFHLDFLAIDKNCAMKSDPDKERIEFWRNVYQNYPPTDYSVLSAKL